MKSVPGTAKVEIIKTTRPGYRFKDCYQVRSDGKTIKVFCGPLAKLRAHIYDAVLLERSD